jgi:phage shock protein PspC (stress-responsive transcriptional regulator)
MDQRSPIPTRIRRSRSERMIAGVAGGIAEHIQVDPVLIRLSFVALAFGGVGFVLYLIGWVVIPLESEDRPSTAPAAPSAIDHAMASRVVVGSILIAVGCLMLIDWAFPVGKYIWPVSLIILGIGVFAYGSRR